MDPTFFLWMDPNQVSLPTTAVGFPTPTHSSLPPSPGTRADSSFADTRSCRKCGKACKGARGYKLHYTKAHLKKKKQVSCKVCGNRFTHKYGMRFHLKQVHSEVLRVPCQWCGQVLYNKYALPRHLRKFHPNET